MSLDNRLAHSHYRVPPDGAGKRLSAHIYLEVAYINATQQFAVGDYVTGQTSLVIGEVVGVFPTDGTTGHIWITIEDESSGTIFTALENLLVDGTPVAQFSSQTDRYIPATISVGKNNPNYGQAIDRKGAAYVRFTEGEQQLDAYGLTRIAQPQILAAYNFQHDSEPEDFYAQMSGAGATQSFDSLLHAVLLDVGTAAGEYSIYTSNIHYPTWPGSGQIINTSVICGDAGKTGVVRRWGYFAEDDGVFFELSGTKLSVVVRSSVSGVPVDTKIEQADWNVDSISVSDSETGMVLDPSKLNVYWFNLQTLTTGRVRYGVLNGDGNRIDVHNAVNINAGTTPQMNRTSLPLRVEIRNVETSVSPSRISWFGAMVKTESPWDTDEIPLSRYSSFTAPKVATSGAIQIPVVSFRSALQFKGLDNHLITVPRLFTAYVSGTSPLLMRIVKNATLNTSSFSSAGTNTPVQGDVAATSMSGGREIYSHLLDVGVNNDSFDSWIWDYRGENMVSRHGIYGDVYTVSVQKMEDDGAPAGVTFGATWADIG